VHAFGIGASCASSATKYPLPSDLDASRNPKRFVNSSNHSIARNDDLKGIEHKPV
jgi:hypothetical protein